MINKKMLMALLLGTASLAAEESLVNGDFESGKIAPWNSPQRCGGKKDLHGIATETEYGKFCVRATGDAENKYNKFITLVQHIPRLEDDCKYVLAARARADVKNIAGKEFKVAVRQANDVNATIAYTGFNIRLDGDTWQYYELCFKPDPRAVSFVLYLIGQDLTAEDFVFIDNIELRKSVNAGAIFTMETIKEPDCKDLAGENMKARIDKSSGLLFSLESHGQVIHPPAKDVSVIFVQQNSKEYKIIPSGETSSEVPFKADVDYKLKNDQLVETVNIIALSDARGPFKIGLRHGFDQKQWKSIINGLRPLRVVDSEKSTIYSFLSNENDLNLGQLDQYQSVCYPVMILENDRFFLLAGSYDIDNFVTLSPNMPSGYFPSLQRNPLSVKKGEIFKFEINWKIFPKSEFLLRDVWRYYSEGLHTTDKELSRFIPPRNIEPKTFYPGCFGSATYFQKNREERLYPGSSIWFYSWHDNISERYPTKGAWWSDGNKWEKKITAEFLRQYVDDLQKKDIKCIFYFRQIANLNEKGNKFPENWYKRKAGGGLHLYGGGYSVKLPEHVAKEIGYDSIPWGSYDFSNPDYRSFYMKELMDALAHYRPAAIGWDMGNDIHEFLFMAEVYETLRKSGMPTKVVSNESAGPTQAYSDMVMLENGLLGGKTSYDFEVAKAFTTAVVCLERWNLFRLAVESNLTGKRTWLADNGISENKRYLDYIMKKNPEINDNIELAMLCQLRACLYDLSLGASPGYMEEIKPVPASLVNFAGEVNGILKINKSFAVKLPNNNDVDGPLAVSVWADSKKLRLAVFNNDNNVHDLNIRLDKKFFQGLKWNIRTLVQSKRFFVTPEIEKNAAEIKIEETETDYLLTGKIDKFTAFLLFADN